MLLVSIRLTHLMEKGVKIGMSQVTTVVFVMGLGMIVLIKEE